MKVLLVAVSSQSVASGHHLQILASTLFVGTDSVYMLFCSGGNKAPRGYPVHNKRPGTVLNTQLH